MKLFETKENEKPEVLEILLKIEEAVESGVTLQYILDKIIEIMRERGQVPENDVAKQYFHSSK